MNLSAMSPTCAGWLAVLATCLGAQPTLASQADSEEMGRARGVL